jgi:transposase
MHPSPVVVGIDVAKAKLDVALPPGDQTWQMHPDKTTIAQLVAQLQALSPTLIVVEATGGLQVPWVAALVAQELPVGVINPRLARDFAKALGYLAKTDRIDARVLAHDGEAVRPSLRPLPHADTQQLRALVLRRHQLLERGVAEHNRLSMAPERVRDAIAHHLNWRHQQLQSLDASRAVYVDLGGHAS